MFEYFRAPRLLRAARWAVLIGITLSSCRSRTEEQLEKLNVTPDEAKRILAELSAKRAEHEAPIERPSKNPPATSAPALAENASKHSPKAATPIDTWLIDELVDVAPAAPSRATAKGVLVINGGNELFLAKVGPLSKSSKTVASPVGTIPDQKGPFALGRGPTVGGKHAYWITSHFLLRRPLSAPYGPLDTVAKDARVGTRASALTLPDDRALVAYIALPKIKNGPLRAKLWLENDTAQPLLLTEPGSSALSVELVEHADQTLALSLEARMGMTALHARRLNPLKRKLATDRVIWVGGTAQPMTEIRALSSADSLLAFVAIEQDITHFGLAVLDLNDSPKSEPTVHWTTFENGQDPAPVASARICGADLLLFARPSTPSPRAPQELVLATLVDGMLVEGPVLSSAKAYYDLSLAALPGGALVSFVADDRTWARTIRCR